MTQRVEHNIDPQEDPNPDAPEGAEGDGTRVTISDDTSASNDPKGTDERPDGLPEKFDSWEDMAASYAELEKKLSQGGDDDDDVDDSSSDDEQGSDESGDELTAEQAVEKAGLDVDALNAEIRENGELSDETYESFEESGITRDMVDGYIEGQKALANQLRADLEKAAGADSKQFDSMLDWAEDGLDADEIEAFNAAMDQGGAAAKMAARSLKAAYVEANGSNPKLVRPGGRETTKGGAKPFGSNEEMTRAMSDRRYKEDPAYRRKVEARIAAGM